MTLRTSLVLIAGWVALLFGPFAVAVLNASGIPVGMADVGTLIGKGLLVATTIAGVAWALTEWE